MTIVIEQVIVLSILMLIGYIAAKKNVLNENISIGITRILTNISLPALIISSFNIGYSKDTLKSVLLVFVYSLGLHILSMLVSKLLFKKYPKEKRGVLSFGTIFSNTAFMGMPLILELFGQEAVLYASVFNIPFHVFLWTYGEGLLSKEKTASPIKKLISTPALIAVLVGMCIFLLKIELPYVMDKPISLLGSLTLPLSMLILGEKITKLKLKDVIGDKDVYYGCFAKLIALPIITLIVLNLINTPEFLRNIMVTMQALPSAVLLVIIAQKHEGDVEFASRLAIVSHMASIITIPIISMLF